MSRIVELEYYIFLDKHKKSKQILLNVIQLIHSSDTLLVDIAINQNVMLDKPFICKKVAYLIEC